MTKPSPYSNIRGLTKWGLLGKLRVTGDSPALSPDCDVEVVGLLAIGGALDDPSTEPWFHFIVHFDGVSGMYDIVTKDGDTYLPLIGYNLSRKETTIPDLLVNFLPEDQLRVREAIKRYVNRTTA